MAGIYDMARELGSALARTDEYQALKRASDAAEEDRDLVELRNRLQALESELESVLRAGKEPDEELKASYTKAAEELQSMAIFQRVVAAQTNFEKVMYKVNETVAKGIEEGAQSRIIISS
ncbi:MAG: YlbF family regulator [Gemmatimonadota bacterium]|nr:YlbF family regulator [Gemmatimonadota bacterium]